MSDILSLEEFKGSEKQAGNAHCLLLGHPVGHSLSPLMHNTAASYYGLDLSYYAVDVDPSELPLLSGIFNHDNFRGANITLPYKQELLSHVDRNEESAENIGAINTLYKDQYELVGTNTDAYGFTVPLKEHEERLRGGKALVFGTGGATRAIVFALGKLGIEEMVLVSRKPGRFDEMKWPQHVVCIGYEAWTSHAEESELIVNATPLGMAPDTDASPVRASEKSALENKICYDIVYKPQKTLFLKQAEKAGGYPIEGLNMLLHQGSRSFNYWTGKTFPVDLIKNTLENAL